MNINNELTWEEKNSIEQKMNYENNQENVLKNTIIETVCRSVKTEWIVIGETKKRIRRCPKCEKIIVYESKNGYLSGKKLNSFCYSCHNKRKIENGYIMPISTGLKASDETKLKMSKSQLERFKQEKSPMNGKNHSVETKSILRNINIGKNNKMFGKTHSVESRLKISNSRIGLIPKPVTEKTKIKLRESKIKRIEKLKLNGHQLMPMFNNKACAFFDLLEKQLGWDGSYATKNREHSIIGFFLDYYEPNLNIVIEWDEKHHYRFGKLKEKDIIRENQIKNKLNCNFYRINEVDFDKESLINEMIKKYGRKKT